MNFFERIDWDWSFAAEIMPVLLQAVVINVQATLLGFLIAVTVGLGFALWRRHPNRWARYPAVFIIEFIRSTPLLVQLYFLFFVLPIWGIRLPALATGIVALGLHFSTYMSEVYRSGLDNVPRGQWEAATALNLTTRNTYLRIIIPQAIPITVPALGNYLVAMFKESALLSAISVVEILQRGKIIGSQTFRYLEPITIAGIVFLVLTIISALLVQAVERALPQQGVPLK
jgi:polar amino acid transport system permease protein